MPDKLVLVDGNILLTTEEGQSVKLPEKQLVELMREQFEPPFNGRAMPDGLKFFHWRPPLLGVVHQWSAHVRQLNWIADDSPVPYGPGVKVVRRRISLPYLITFAIYFHRPPKLMLTDYNELYFRNEPLRTMDDPVCFPALLNVSRIKLKSRDRAWICTQHLRRGRSPGWDTQLAALLEHMWNGSFTLSSEFHEGASWYGASKGVHPDLHPISRWEEATRQNEAFALQVPWKPAPLKVGQLLDTMLTECSQGRASRVIAQRTHASKTTDIIHLLLKSLKKAKAS